MPGRGVRRAPLALRTAQHADVGAVGVPVAGLGGARRGGKRPLVERLDADLHDVAREVARGGRTEPELVGAAHAVRKRRAADLVDDQARALEHVAQGEALRRPVGRDERDGVRTLGKDRPVENRRERHAAHVGVDRRSAVGGVAEARAAHHRTIRAVLRQFAERRLVRLLDPVAVDGDPPRRRVRDDLAGQRGLGTLARPAQHAVDAAEGAGDLRMGGHAVLGVRKRADRVGDLDVRRGGRTGCRDALDGTRRGGRPARRLGRPSVGRQRIADRGGGERRARQHRSCRKPEGAGVQFLAHV